MCEHAREPATGKQFLYIILKFPPNRCSGLGVFYAQKLKIINLIYFINEIFGINAYLCNARITKYQEHVIIKKKL